MRNCADKWLFQISDMVFNEDDKNAHRQEQFFDDLENDFTIGAELSKK
jgi:hypothetical protein